MEAQNPEAEIVPDEALIEEEESSLGEETVSSTQSLSSSIVDYRRENGRTYYRYKDGTKYEVKRVLDLGTCTGIWAMDFGDGHTEAHVVGVDLSPIQPTIVPPSVEFFIDDIDEEWNHSATFDYIHSRMMTSRSGTGPTISKRSTSKNPSHAFLPFLILSSNLNPGGYIELQEADLFLSSNDGILQPTKALP
ncbi:hypothetical protein NCS52_01079800 [Fusarium sp. LHS14.1]|nr:hypothetical protein NCS52_01079800 [Fusarium sp. LHS14.1]